MYTLCMESEEVCARGAKSGRGRALMNEELLIPVPKIRSSKFIVPNLRQKQRKIILLKAKSIAWLNVYKNVFEPGAIALYSPSKESDSHKARNAVPYVLTARDQTALLMVKKKGNCVSTRTSGESWLVVPFTRSQGKKSGTIVQYLW